MYELSIGSNLVWYSVSLLPALNEVSEDLLPFSNDNEGSMYILFTSVSLFNGLNFSSNDYLGIKSGKMRHAQFQSSSRLVSGNDTSFSLLEKKLARHKSQEQAIIFPPLNIFLLSHVFNIPPELIIIGFLGSFTTFSAFTKEVLLFSKLIGASCGYLLRWEFGIFIGIFILCFIITSRLYWWRRN